MTDQEFIKILIGILKEKDDGSALAKIRSAINTYAYTNNAVEKI